MARTPIKFEARVPVPATALDVAGETEKVPESFRLIAPRTRTKTKIEPIPAEALEGLGMFVVGLVQIATDGETQVVPVGLAPFAGSDTVAVPSAGFFLDERGRCGILLNGNDGSWQKALPEAVEEARKALAVATAS